MPISSEAKAAMFAQETGEAFFKLLTIDHESLVQPLRFVDREIGLVSNGAAFIGAAFEIDLPDDSPDGLPTVQLSVDNVDRQIVDTLRRLSGQVLAEPLVVLTVSYQYGIEGALIGAIYEPACIIVGDVVLTLLEVADAPLVHLTITDQPLVLLETSDHRC